jgi:hypothetical protein
MAVDLDWRCRPDGLGAREQLGAVLVEDAAVGGAVLGAHSRLAGWAWWSLGAWLAWLAVRSWLTGRADRAWWSLVAGVAVTAGWSSIAWRAWCSWIAGNAGITGNVRCADGWFAGVAARTILAGRARWSRWSLRSGVAWCAGVARSARLARVAGRSRFAVGTGWSWRAGRTWLARRNVHFLAHNRRTTWFTRSARLARCAWSAGLAGNAGLSGVAGQTATRAYAGLTLLANAGEE